MTLGFPDDPTIAINEVRGIGMLDRIGQSDGFIFPFATQLGGDGAFVSVSHRQFSQPGKLIRPVYK